PNLQANWTGYTDLTRKRSVATWRTSHKPETGFEVKVEFRPAKAQARVGRKRTKSLGNPTDIPFGILLFHFAKEP
ncbi:MAG TPA: hypothetical protein VNN16_08375, partial [Candidatus Sulfotelmatobacter sp.]|nr:hypothetical protein [Candidatus Sulfotelmatobacter sp.]